VVPADSDRVSRARSYSGAVVASASAFAYGAFTLHGGRFHALLLAVAFVTDRPRCGAITDGPTTPNRHRPAGRSFRYGLGSSRFARHYSGNRGFFPFLGLLRCFSSPAYLHCTYGFSAGYPRITTGGFPHSETPGSKPVDGSPRLIAVNDVLHRLLVPRHPPNALVLLIM
jgi:hypothetical protein